MKQKVLDWIRVLEVITCCFIIAGVIKHWFD